MRRNPGTLDISVAEILPNMILPVVNNLGLRFVFAVLPLTGLLDREAAEPKAVELFRAMILPGPDTVESRFPHQVTGGHLIDQRSSFTASAMGSKQRSSMGLSARLRR